MDRLTRTEFQGTECEPYVYGGIEFYGDSYGGEVIKKLADYEDAEEQGLLLRLPVAIGSTIYHFEYPKKIDDNGTEWSILDKKRATIKPMKFALCHLDSI